MKVIGIGENKTYICEINHTELEQFLNKYYGNLKRLEVGDEINLGKGYKFYADTKQALNETRTFIKANEKIIKTILDGITFLNTNNEP